MTIMRENNIDSTHPLTPMQMGMLIDQLIDPGSDIYFQQVVASTHNQLDIIAFQKAWERVIERHSVLRTSFRWEGIEEPIQEIHTIVNLPFEYQDWRALSSLEQESKFNNYLEADKQTGFDLRTTPVLRIALFRMGDAEYRAIFSSHHIILDGRGWDIMLTDFAVYYTAFCKGEDVRLDPALPFHEHVSWLQEKDFADSETFWRELLQGFTAPVEIPTNSFGKKDQGQRTGRGLESIQLPESTTSALKIFAKQNNLTLNTIFQAAWALLLSHYCNEEDVVFGAVRACRHSTIKGGIDIAGCFINTLPVRVRISPEQFLIPWLQELREQHLAVRPHEQTPLSQILEWSQIPRPTPIFESIVVYNHLTMLSSLRNQHEFWNTWDIKTYDDNEFPIVIHGTGGDSLALSITYQRSRIDDVASLQILHHLSNLLEAIANGHDIPIGSLPFITESEKNKILVDWNDTKTDYNLDTCLHEIFENQVEKTPNSLAVRYENTRLTYQELNCRANQLAHHLIKCGVGPETLVGVYLERSLELIIALYGILKAGGAYVPLDPEYPTERVDFMLQDTQMPILLTQERLLSRLPERNIQVVCLDTDWDTITKEANHNPNSGVMAENLAYVIYTSGSTGKPKGAMNTHRGIVNRLLWMQDAFQLTEKDRVLQKTPFSFDVSVWEFFWPLLFGAQLIVARPGGHRDSSYLVKTILDQEITTIHFVPSMLQIFLEDRDVQKCISLKRVICSGESLPFDLQNRFFSRLDAELHNLYGPTEAAVDVSHWACRRDSDLKIVPIGRPIANTQLYILDRSLNPVPVGVLGELHIGGVQVARGYLSRPDLTAEKFIPDPFIADPEARLYKTGDLVRFLPDGNIEFVGRLDHQVKLRGFRIELGEIESVLSQHKQIREVVVVAREDVPGDKRLVAYCVSSTLLPPNIEELRNFLSEKLPEHMIPSAFVHLDTLPLTPNGKVDRKNLPVPDWKEQSERVYLPPEDDLEKAIADIWVDVLKVERVGVNENFFDLGGHSLLLALAYNQIRDLVEKEISITDLFRFPTIRTLSLYLSQISDHDGQRIMQESSDRAKARRETLIRRRTHKIGERDKQR